MAKRQVFYSFHFDNDVMRVQQIRNIGAIEDNKPVAANEWEKIRKSGDEAIKKWISEHMDYRSCVIVLVGEETANRPWVKYEIKKAWNDGKGLVGIYIHNLKDPRTSNTPPYYGKCRQGANPFDQFSLDGKSLSSIVKCYNPSSTDAYNDIKNNLENWIEEAIEIRKNYKS
ncbi:MAG: TIR domain-containing protein [Melioribacteraceae bacterium]|nr:TIR domain-containing protein [Melioribacteraceae bacterium]